ncbi:MAG: NTP transferase domain-containing protein [Actinomycetota bacterium]|nr:NTP transferase domain-containing protein [Actinomycetota bacterium]
MARNGPPRLAVILLAGGRARRMGGIDKPALLVGGRTLAARAALAAVRAGAGQVIVVGPDRDGLRAEIDAASARPGGLVPAIRFVSEDPPGAGPVPALRAGLALVAEPRILLLAADLPFLRQSDLRALLAATGAGDGAALTDDEHRVQWLTSCWRTGRLRDALAEYRGDSLRGLLDPLRPVLVPAEPAVGAPPSWLDCDTPEDVAAALGWAERAAEPR